MKNIKNYIVLILILFFNSSVFAQETFEEYAKILRKDISTTWNSSIICPKSTDIYFKIDKAGNISDIKVLNSSGNNKFDLNALNSIKEIMMYNPLPKGYNADFIEVIVTFTNQNSKNINLNKNVKIKKMMLRTNFLGTSNFKSNMKKLEPNVFIQKELNKKS